MVSPVVGLLIIALIESSRYCGRRLAFGFVLPTMELLTNILQLIALQLGSEVSRNEIASKLRTSRETIERYLDLLEKAFVIFRLKPLSRNRHNKIARKEKIYFSIPGPGTPSYRLFSQLIGVKIGGTL